MNNYHRLGSLAPRDIVARAIDSELKKTGDKHVYLDMSSKSIDFLRKRFPNIIGHCEALGVDLSTGLIPVACLRTPLRRLTDMNANTSVDGLLAIGEVACTGLHGANRLASNSLLEGRSSPIGLPKRPVGCWALSVNSVATCLSGRTSMFGLLMKRW